MDDPSEPEQEQMQASELTKNKVGEVKVIRFTLVSVQHCSVMFWMHIFIYMVQIYQYNNSEFSNEIKING